MPVTTPVELIVATEVVLLLQVPPAAASPKLVVDPAHTTKVPVIVVGTGLTVMGVVAEQPVASV